MKLVRLATIAALSSTVFAGGMTVFAEDGSTDTSKEVRNVTTNGTIEFTPNEDEELVVVPPVKEPDVEIEPEVPGTTGPLSIMKAVTMDFGSQVISNQDRTYNMVAEKQQKREQLVKKTKSLMSVLHKYKMSVERMLVGICKYA